MSRTAIAIADRIATDGNISIVQVDRDTIYVQYVVFLPANKYQHNRALHLKRWFDRISDDTGVVVKIVGHYPYKQKIGIVRLIVPNTSVLFAYLKDHAKRPTREDRKAGLYN